MRSLLVVKHGVAIADEAVVKYAVTACGEARDVAVGDEVVVKYAVTAGGEVCGHCWW
jgi:hypothetical protein